MIYYINYILKYYIIIYIYVFLRFFWLWYKIEIGTYEKDRLNFQPLAIKIKHFINFNL